MKNFTRSVIIALLTIGGGALMQAQDIHFSQFYQSPLNLNPALTGVMDCNIRFVGNYRNQWSPILRGDAYNTYSASYDQKFAAFRKDYFGVGATFWGDKAGEVEFSTLQARLSGSFSKYLGGGRTQSHYLVFGVDGGLAQRSVDLLNARYGNQNVNGQYDEDIPSGETFDNTSFLFGDLSAGILFFSTFDERQSFYIGGAYHHINSPNVSFANGNEAFLYSKYTLHAGGEYPFSRRASIVPGIVSFFQGPSFQVNGGTSVRFQLGNSRYEDQSFQIGAWVRLANAYVWSEENIEDYTIHTDAIILSARFQYNQFDFGISYDVNVSSLRQGTNGNGSFEFSMIYTICQEVRRGVYCPSF